MSDLDVIQTEQRLIDRCAQLRAWATRTGHPLGHKIHEADRWVAATALALDLELIAGDRVFNALPGLALLAVTSS